MRITGPFDFSIVAATSGASEIKTQRLRDPVHGLIVFREGDAVDELAWKLIDTPEFQRLRRIKQLGVSEFTFPGATHTRFAHSIGVFHNARKLAELIKRELPKIPEEVDERRVEVALIAALLHDLGHGPFSHTFEGVQKSLGNKKRHEKWTAEIIENQRGEIAPLLKGYWTDGSFGREVATLLEAEDPIDIYHSIVSSSFDADRLDYLRRDRLMTGTGAGAIDFDWLMEHVRVGRIQIDAPDAGDAEPSAKVATFCLDPKALPAAEQFLLARYTLHQQVYFHKATRCIEKMIGKLLRAIAAAAKKMETASEETGLSPDHPFLAFFAADGGTVDRYLDLDDTALWGSLHRMESAKDAKIRDLAMRLRRRKLYKTLDMAHFGEDRGKQRMMARKTDQNFEREIADEVVIKDDGAEISIYTQIGGDDEKAHKKLHILDRSGPVEISSLSAIVRALEPKLQFIRYYFEKESDRDLAKKGKGHDHVAA